jgi:hypothetical protein
MISSEKSELLYDFLDKWPLEKVKLMNPEDYTGLDDKSTFCYSVEHETLKLGTIRGYPSAKFGFFRWGKNFKKTTKKNNFDKKYAWPKKFGTSRKKVFQYVKDRICDVIEAAQICDLKAIEGIDLNAWYKWKIASLYSEGRIPPIFKQEVIENIATEYEIPTKKGSKEAVLSYIMNGIPENECRFEYVFELFKEFDGANHLKHNKKNEKEKLRFRKKASYTAENRHNIIQNKLFRDLRKKHPNDKVVMEEKFVDIFRENNKGLYFYEVKSNPSPTYCVREALGQVLHYAHKYRSSKIKNIIVVGENIALRHDELYFKFIKEQVSINFTYMNIPI